MTFDLERIEEAAKACRTREPETDFWFPPEYIEKTSGGWLTFTDAEFIAATSPDSVLALVEVARAARAVADDPIGHAATGKLGELQRALEAFA